jgi:energy-coupling factor transport system substrate-specific component
MSWEVASFLILAAVLIGGFAWYERSRPPSQVVALVAALAALAVAGRVALAAVPNVVATTDIVIFSGYALGAAPGFAVGALAGLISNFWLGQGPWTPWQMAAWGLCGILGAALALGGRRRGRLSLAVACGLAGVLYGALLNFSLMATYGGDLSWQRFLALESRAVPFDAAHATGNAALALAAGPAMVRALARLPARFEWRPAAAVASLLLALLAVAAMPAPARATDASDAAAWLASVQNDDGGWGASPDRGSSLETTAWVALGLEATGRNPLDVSRSGHSAIDYLRANAGELESSGELARTTLALTGAGVDPRSFGGRDLVGALLKRRRSNGSYEGWPTSTAFAVIALRAAGADGSLEASLSWLARIQNDDGGWGDLPGSPSTADSTAAVTQALPDSKPADRALAYLRRAQRPSGGFPLGGTGPVNSQSTAWAVQGIVAVGADPALVREGGNSALDYLGARRADDGHYSYSSSSDRTPVWVTGQVLAAVAQQPFPVPPAPRAPQPAPPAGNESSTFPSTGLQPSGSSPSTSSEEGGFGASGTGGTAGPGAAGAPPASGVPAPPSAGVPEGASPEPAATAPSGPPFKASEKPGPKPWAPVGVGLAGSGIALGSVLLLGRRFGW